MNEKTIESWFNGVNCECFKAKFKKNGANQWGM